MEKLAPVVDIGEYKLLPPRPLSKMASVVEPMPAQMTATELLQELTTGNDVDAIDEILIMLRYKDGQSGFVTNVDGIAESLLFIERVKFRMMNAETEGPEIA